jgi:hypothetical protein
MPTVNEYKVMLGRAQAAGDADAAKYFQSQIDSGLKMTRPGGEPVPQGGNFLNALSGGIPFFDELAGAGGGIASTLMGEGFSKGYDSIAGDLRKARSEYSERHPYLSTAGEIAGGAATLAGAAPAKITGSLLADSGLIGGLYGAGEADNGDLGDRVEGGLGGAAGGVAGHAVGSALSGIGRIILPRVMPKAKGPAFKEDVKTLEDAGIPVTSAERIASPSARMAEKMSGAYFGMGDNIADRDRRLMSQLMERTNFARNDVATGELSRDAVGRAKARFGTDYDAVLQNARVKLQDIDPELTRIEAEVGGMLPFEQKAQIANVLKDIRNQVNAGRVMSGPEYKMLRSNLGKAAEQTERNPLTNHVAPAYRAAKRALDDAFRNAARPGVADRLRAIDSQYGGFKVLEEAVKNPEALGSLAANAYKNRRRIDPQFLELLRAYENVLMRGYPKSSGTAENHVSSQLVPPILPTARAAGAAVADLGNRTGLRLPLPPHLRALVQGKLGETAAQAATVSNAEKKRRREDVE